VSIEFVLSGRYRLLSPLGEGGMASVFAAHDQKLNRRVAVKILSENLVRDAGFLRRFQAEAEAVANLSHPNIVSVYDVGQDGDRHYIVMELVNGQNLKHIIQDRAPIPASQAVVIACQVLEGLSYAHDHGLVHRDIKPQNILVTRDNVAKLADFGIAKAIDASSATQTAAVLGSAHYLSPEQARGEEVAPESDLYSLAVVIYEMCTGDVPFDGSNLLAVAARHINEEPKNPSALNPAVPAALSRVVLTGLAKEPSDRYSSAADMNTALRAIATDADVEVDLGTTYVNAKSAGGETSAASATIRSDSTATRPSVLGFGMWATFMVVVAILTNRLGVFAGGELPRWLVDGLPYLSAAIGAVAVLLIGYGLVARLRCRYVIDRYAVTVEVGLLGHHRDAIPLPAIVNLQLHQSPVARIFDVGTIVLTTVQVPGQGPATLHLRDVARVSDVYETILHRIGGGARLRYETEPGFDEPKPPLR
jgi:membrane protein YdbS with pleckstrin-like domain